MSELLRLFFAVPLPDRIRTGAKQLQQNLTCRGVNIGWVQPENLHFTLKFLGEVPTGQVARLADVAEQVAHSLPVHHITVAGVDAFPNVRRPRIIWIGCTEGDQQLRRLGTDLDSALAQAELSEAEKQDFIPHITIGRVRKGRNFDQLTAELEHLAGSAIGQMSVDHFVLMRSDLQPSGPPKYTELARCELS